MGRYRALLLGVAEYGDTRIDPLPFVTDDVASLVGHLETIGYEVRLIGDDSGFVGRTSALVGMQSFIAAAEPGDNLLILLSGHGLHYADKDYLVPSDFDMDLEPRREGLVPVDWGKEIQASEAGTVLCSWTPVVKASTSTVGTRWQSAIPRLGGPKARS